MFTPPRRLLAALLVALVAVLAAACTPEDGNGPEGSSSPEASVSPGGSPSPEPQGTSRPVGDEPLGDEEVTLHMANPPELPPELEGAVVVTAELRSDDLADRHVVQLVDVPDGTTALAEALPAGAVLRVPAGQTLEIETAVDVAVLEPDATEDEPGVVETVDSRCASPCAVEGPALVAPEGWMAGFGIAPTWHLVVASPAS